MLSSSLILDFEAAKASIIVPGLNAAARPNIEPALRKRRRDPSSGSFIMCSFRVALDFWVVWSSSRHSLLRSQYQG
jgi:hypothetical protein